MSINPNQDTEQKVMPKPVGVKIDDKELAEAILEMKTHVLWLESVKRPRIAEALKLVLSAVPGSKQPRPRNPIMDAMAEACGYRLNEVSPPLWSTIAKAIKDIKAVCPDVGGLEIRTRASNYKTKWNDRELTPTALAKWWGSCGNAQMLTSRTRLGDNL